MLADNGAQIRTRGLLAARRQPVDRLFACCQTWRLTAKKPPMNEAEWQTRKQRIDTRLRALQPPWKIIRYRDGLDLSTLDQVAVEEFPTENGPADYGLFVGGQLLGIIEAKKVTVNPQNVLEQAKRYAEGHFKVRAIGTV